MDSRFKNIDSELDFTINPSEISGFFDEVDTYVMDNAFVEASQELTYPYAPAFWNNFSSQETEIVQNVNFSEAANNYNAAYNPMFWNQAEEVLANEGLHFRYNSTYWSEAEKLLVASDKRIFFTKWISIASVLLLIGFASQPFFQNFEKSKTQIVESNKQPAPMSNQVQDESELDEIKLNETATNFSDAEKITVASKNMLSAAELLENAEKTTNSTIQPSTFDSRNAKKTIISKPTSSKIVKNNSDFIAENHSPNKSTTKRIDITSNNFNTDNKDRSQSSHISKISAHRGVVLQNKPIRAIKPVLQAVTSMKAPRNIFPQIYTVLQVGAGNSFHSNKNFAQRFNFDVGVSLNIPKIAGLRILIQSGFDIQNLSSYTTLTQKKDYLKSDRITTITYGYEFGKLLKWQTGILLGYRISKKLTLNVGTAIDQYFTSSIKVHEIVNDQASDSDFNWGRNDFINQTDLQVLAQIEYQIFNKFAIIASGEIGLLNQINNPLFVQSQMNRSAMIGLKYRLF